MKNQRSSTLSSPYDSYMYSQDSIEMNPISANNNILDDSPFQKLRGLSQKSQNRSNIDQNSIINTSPFVEGTSIVGIPITYLNLSNHSSQVNEMNNNIQRKQSEPQNKLGQFAQSQTQQYKQKQILKDNKSMNRNDLPQNNNKIEDSGSPTDKNSCFDTGTFGTSVREDNFNQQLSHRMYSQSQDFSKNLNTYSYESPYSKNISTEIKTNQSFVNENQGSISKSKLNSTHLSYFSPGPLQQPKQSIILNEQEKSQVDHKTFSPLQNKIPTKYIDKIQINLDLSGKDKSNNKQIFQNENVRIPKVQSSEPIKQNQITSYSLNFSNQNSNLNNISSNSNTLTNLLNQYSQKNNSDSKSKLQINKFKSTEDNNGQNYYQSVSNSNSFDKNNSFKEQKQLPNFFENTFNSKDSQMGNFVVQNDSQTKLNYLPFQKQFTFQKQQTQEEVKDASNQDQNQQKIQVQQLSKFSNNFNQDFNPQSILTNESEHFPTNQSPTLTPQKQQQKQEVPQSSMNEFYESMFRQNEEQVNKIFSSKQRSSNSQIYYSNMNINQNDDENKKHSRPKSQNADVRKSQGQLDFDRINISLKESEKQNQEKKIDILKLQSERDNLKQFIKNLETRNNLLNERIHLLEVNLQNLNTQNLENIDRIINLNKQLQEQDSNLQKKNEPNQQQKDLIEAAQRQNMFQNEIQRLISKDLEQEQKILDLTNKLNSLQNVRSDYEKALREQEILVKNNQNSIQIIESQKAELQKLSNLLQTKNQKEIPQTKLLIEKSEEEKKKLENECQKLQEKNKNLEEHLSTMKISCQKLEQAMAANCNQTKGWLEKYNKLEKSYLNLQNQFRAEQQKQFMEKNFASKKDLMSNRSQQSFNKFRSELSEQEIKVQFQRNQELIREEVQNERDELSHENQQLKQKITELQNQNTQYEQKISVLMQNNKNQQDENEIQKKDLISKLNLMINENNKLIGAYNERPVLLQRIQQLTQQNLDSIKQQVDNSTPFITQLSNLESSGISLQIPPQFNSAQEEIKWYRLKCNQLEVKLKVKSEECAELIYQNKQIKKQKGNNQEELTIKSSLYQTFQQSPNSNIIKQPGKFQSEIVLNANKQNIQNEEKDNRGFCEKWCQNNKDNNSNQENINSDSGRESFACNAKCL